MIILLFYQLWLNKMGRLSGNTFQKLFGENWNAKYLYISQSITKTAECHKSRQ